MTYVRGDVLLDVVSMVLLRCAYAEKSPASNDARATPGDARRSTRAEIDLAAAKRDVPHGDVGEVDMLGPDIE